MANAHRLATNARVGMMRIAFVGIAIGSYALLASTGAIAQGCGLAGATGSMDTSTSQSLELIRDRRMQVAQSCPAGTMPSATGMCVPMTAGAATPTAAQPPPAAQPRAKGAPRKGPSPQAAPAAPSVPYGSLKDDFAEPPRVRHYGIWAEGYGDYERRTDVSPDGQSVRFTSYGVVSGLDHTHLRSPREGVLIGALAGYNDTHGRFSGDVNLQPRRQDIEGAMLGFYGTYFHGGFAIDVLAKADLFDLDQRGIGCGTTGTGSTSLTNYVIASNIYHRRDYGHMWLEPTAGFRYVSSEYGGGADVLGLDDGEALRL